MTAVIQNLAKFTKDGTVIYVDNIDWKNNWTNGITVINQSTTEETPNESLLINLNKVEERYTITGYLTNGKHLDTGTPPTTSSETYTTARDKKNALKTMFSKGSTVTLTLEEEDLVGGVDKYEISYRARDSYDETQTDSVIYDVVISFVEGGDVV